MNKYSSKLEQTATTAILTATLIIILVAFGFYKYSFIPTKKIVEEPVGFCGVPDPSPEAVKGTSLFLNNCAACHSKNEDLIGPALVGVTYRWEKFPNDLYRYIQNAQKLVEEKHPRAMSLRENWTSATMPMPIFQTLDSTEINYILAYIESKS